MIFKFKSFTESLESNSIGDVISFDTQKLQKFLKEPVNQLFSPKDFVDRLKKEHLSSDTYGDPNHDYGWMVSDECIHSCVWMVGRLIQYGYSVNDVKIVHGNFNNHNHWWIEWKKFIIDLTLQQFDDTVPELCIIDLATVSPDIFKKHWKYLKKWKVNDEFLNSEPGSWYDELWDKDVISKYQKSRK